MENKENMSAAEAIIQTAPSRSMIAAHILANNRARTSEGTALGGLEAHSMMIAEAIHSLSEQMGRIADALEESSRA